jgi:hypothetical protein
MKAAIRAEESDGLVCDFGGRENFLCVTEITAMLIICSGHELSLDHLVALPSSCGRPMADAHEFAITRTLPGRGILTHGYFYVDRNSAGQERQIGESTGMPSGRRRVNRWPFKADHQSLDPRPRP